MKNNAYIMLCFIFAGFFLMLNACSRPVQESLQTYYATFEFDEKDIISMYDNELYLTDSIQRVCYAYDYIEKETEIIQYDITRQKSKKKELEHLVFSYEIRLEQEKKIIDRMKNELQNIEDEYAILSDIYISMTNAAESVVAEPEVVGSESAEPDVAEPEPVEPYIAEPAFIENTLSPDQIAELEHISNWMADLSSRIKDASFELEIQEKSYEDDRNILTQYVSELDFYTNMTEFYRAPETGYILSINCTIKENRLYIGQLIPENAIHLRIRIVNNDERTQFNQSDIVMVKIDTQWYTSSVVNILENTIELEVSGELAGKVNFYNPIRVALKKDEI